MKKNIRSCFVFALTIICISCVLSGCTKTCRECGKSYDADECPYCAYEEAKRKADESREELDDLINGWNKYQRTKEKLG